MEMLTIDNVSFTFANSGLKIMNRVSFNVEHGEFVSIVGPSGCGK